MSIEPSDDYVIPIGKAMTVRTALSEEIEKGNSLGIITYGRGVYWSLEAMKGNEEQIELLDLRSLHPIDHQAMNTLCRKHGKVILVTEESIECNFMLGIAGKLQRDNFMYLDAPIEIVGSVDTPAIPLNSELELALLPNGERVKESIEKLFKL